MKCVFFYHAFSSCWNNGNAHFLRGVTRELAKLGHEVVVYEPVDGWSRQNARVEGGELTVRAIPGLFPSVHIRPYDGSLDLEEALDGADLVVVHEWNPPDLIKQIGARRAHVAPFTLLFHDTHHRAVTKPDELAQFDLEAFDGVLAFGEVLRQIYLRLGWANRVFTWHEGADVALYRPLQHIVPQYDLVWIGNWGDDERSAELREYLIDPVAELRLRARIHGVRYPRAALNSIQAAGIEFGGWLPAHLAPIAFAEARATVHVPRGPYARSLRGIPTIRMFEAMACGIPVVSAPWDDAEGLFTPTSYLRANNGKEMKARLHRLLVDRDLATETAAEGLRLVRERHTCRHRVIELLDIVDMIRSIRPAHSPALQEEAVP
ncbi:MAG: glycosyltransferase [Bradyrhizobium sp.]|uniref:CgeB family protein n=1 Tax=Bradyrhizobium sp. TaxID=376 RepID=UPI0025BD8B26|nr:glycosyltransferase [Bradyrhizobium sp.]MBI5264709.1 glycosyltransferase [Bradyrhizobium sp.]